jgi:KTSC domain-containing protein
MNSGVAATATRRAISAWRTLLAAILIASGLCAARICNASPVERTPVQSSVIAAVGYDEAAQTLEIEFHSGAVYRYFKVPPTIYHELLDADSKGRFYNQNIRRHFRSRKIVPSR